MDAKRPIAPSAPTSAIAAPLLAWYDLHRRDLPWRAAPGVAADPYRVWLSEVMLQQTTVATVRPRFAAWIERWPTFADLAAAPEADVMAQWAGLGYYARARNLLAAARIVATAHGGALPDDEVTLRGLPGFGDYTAAAVAAIAFGRRAVVVDANVERIVARLFAIPQPLPAARAAIRAVAATITPAERAGDFAQAMMDLGSAVCTPHAPKCLLCPIASPCAARATGAPDAFPLRKAKAPRPHRHGTVFWLEDEGGRVLLERRPARGLLGGMRALPTGPWADSPPGLAGAPAAVDWTLHNVTVSHGFTHFTLDLALAVGHIRGDTGSVAGEWCPVADLASAGLPTVFAKAAAAIEMGRSDG